MKKILLSLIAVMVLSLSFVACGDVIDSTDSTGSTSAETVLTAKTEMTLEVGESANVDAVVTPEAEITYVSSDDAVATVDENGLVTAVAEGTADITIRADGESVKCVVTVPHVYTYEVTLAEDAYEMFVGDEEEVVYTITADGNEYTLADGDSVALSVEGDAATVENNTVKAVAVGSATLKVAAVLNGKTVTDTATVTVVESATIQYSVEGVLSNPVKCAVGTEIQKPANPTLAGFEFYGWFVGETPFDFSAGITEDTIVTARFAKVFKLVASDEAAVTFENSWIQGCTSYTYTTDVKFGNEAGSTAVSSDFNEFDGAWCEPNFGSFSFSKYYKVWFSFSFDKATNFSFNSSGAGSDSGDYSNWVAAVPGQVYTCTIQANENPGRVNIYLKGTDYLDGDLWYYNLERSNLKDAALTHVTKVDEVTMYIGAIWGATAPSAVLFADAQTEGSIAYDFATIANYNLNNPIELLEAGKLYASLEGKLARLTPYEYEQVMTSEYEEILNVVEVASKIKTGVINNYSFSRYGANAINAETGVATPVYEDPTGDAATGSMINGGNLYFYLQIDPHGRAYYQVTLPKVDYSKYLCVEFTFVTNNALGVGFSLENSVTEDAVSGKITLVYYNQKLTATITTNGGKTVTSEITDSAVINGTYGVSFFVAGQAYTDLKISPATAYYIPAEDVTVFAEIVNFTDGGHGAKAINVSTGAVTPYGDANSGVVANGSKLKFYLQTDPQGQATYMITLPAINFNNCKTVYFTFETNNGLGVGFSEENAISASPVKGEFVLTLTEDGLVITVVANGQTITTTITDTDVINGNKGISFYAVGQAYTEIIISEIFAETYTA